MISKISSTCFGQSFAQFQERKTEIFMTYGIVSCCWGRQGYGEQPITTTGQYTIGCKNLSYAPEDGQKIPRNMLSWSLKSINCYCCIYLVSLYYFTYIDDAQSNTNQIYMCIESAIYKQVGFRIVIYILPCSVYCAFIVPTGFLRLPWLRFFRAFSSVVRQMRRYNSQRRGKVRTLPN